ncbi:NAD(P)(+)--arginine ADP-ribosyltransferase 2-like [Silurus meridionalis]|uniref:NAD(P)(+)--arginine ADP-ribosyltransferase n=1 Tax=Silurus meridionalis TaxID=175797 RepID=A0A8T0BIP6_SILME|nr:NAD(P)(+)--arginine ADP-ribosyltransferase 2-like [Silurus meridionalis]KAF7705627.1 hypothetical protein HF521_020913 [Silurus meridionalis]
MTAVKFSSTGNNIVAALLIIFTVCCQVKLSRTSNSGYKLDMAKDSVDDQFIGCEKTMFYKIKQQILPKEFKFDVGFTTTWNKYKNIPDDFKRIIKVYTSPYGSYSKLNNAVGSGRPKYKTHFNYKAYHFLLTRAIQKYQVKQCTNVFRWTKVNFDSAFRGQQMRFGRFASTTLKSNLPGFGTKTCFKIRTCFGAYISSMSVFPNEQEVLIPPYEKFIITNVMYNTMNCRIVYTLQSTGKFSNMNCALLKNY